MRVNQPRVTIGPYVRGEKQPPVVYQFRDANGVSIDLTGYAVSFTVATPSGVATSYTGTLYAPASGQVSYAWTGTEWPEAGTYTAEFWAGNGTVRYASIRIVFAVREPVGGVPQI